MSKSWTQHGGQRQPAVIAIKHETGCQTGLFWTYLELQNWWVALSGVTREHVSPSLQDVAAKSPSQVIPMFFLSASKWQRVSQSNVHRAGGFALQFSTTLSNLEPTLLWHDWLGYFPEGSFLILRTGNPKNNIKKNVRFFEWKIFGVPPWNTRSDSPPSDTVCHKNLEHMMVKLYNLSPWRNTLTFWSLDSSVSIFHVYIYIYSNVLI